MLKRTFIFVLWMTAVMTLSAQTDIPPVSQPSEMINDQRSKVNENYIGYLSYEAVLRSMAQYDSVQVHMEELRQAYEKEMKRVEDEFNQKYEEFLEGRAQYPRTILLKRQQELQDMMQRNINFKNESRSELAEAQKKAMAPLRARLNEVIATVARQEGLVIVVNTDSEACPFIDPDVSQDIEEKVIQIINTP